MGMYIESIHEYCVLDFLLEAGMYDVPHVLLSLVLRAYLTGPCERFFYR